jgi:hypothetical protein
MGFELVPYDSFEDCRARLLRMGVDETHLDYILEHERAHYEKALELGYKPILQIIMLPDFPPIVDGGRIDFDGKVPQRMDMIDILLAPTYPGDDDFELAEKIRSQTGIMR